MVRTYAWCFVLTGIAVAFAADGTRALWASMFLLAAVLPVLLP
jgi:hypothetical protein